MDKHEVLDVLPENGHYRLRSSVRFALMIQVFRCSEPGGHVENEDAFEARPLLHDQESYLCAVADGQGGRAGGAVAAQTACKVCADTALALPPSELLRPRSWTKILATADAAVADHPKAGFTTVVAFYITRTTICGASSGDSAVALLNANKPSEILTARQHKNPPVGSRAATFASFEANLNCPWKVLAMSDGVWKYAGWEKILRLASEKHDEEIISSIRDCARMQRSGGLQDDFTLVVLLDDAD